MNKGIFVISLDFELYWGVRDVFTLEQYKSNILGVYEMLPKMLELFEKYKIHTTWGVVGFLFFKNKKELLKHIPSIKPQYVNKILSPYENNYLHTLHEYDKLHLAPDLIQLIKKTPCTEIASHTFSHYYCSELGQDMESFECDILMAKDIANQNGINLKSIIFPRNQVNDSYLEVCFKIGMEAYRGNPSHFFSHPKVVNRLMRLLDTYINISGHNTYNVVNDKNKVVNIPASRFLRPYSKRLSFLESLKLKRIKNEMLHAAQQHQVYHLWWHPHNFGVNQKQNLDMLQNILLHYKILEDKYGFQSCTMNEVTSLIKN